MWMSPGAGLVVLEALMLEYLTKEPHWACSVAEPRLLVGLGLRVHKKRSRVRAKVASMTAVLREKMTKK